MIRELLQQLGQLFTWIVVVAPWEQALRVRLGKHVKLCRAGWYLKIPFIDRIYRQSTRRRVSIVAPQILTTTDDKAVTVAGCIGFKIGDLRKLYDTLHDAADTIEAEVNGRVAEFVRETSSDECTPSEIERYVMEKLDLSRYGLTDQEFFVSNFAVVKTYRLLTGEIRSWGREQTFTTNTSEGGGRFIG